MQANRVTSRATANPSGSTRVARVVLSLIAVVTLVACSELHGAPAGVSGVRVGTRHPAVGDLRSTPRARAGDAPALRLLDSHESGLFNLGAAEIVDFHPASRRVFVVNSKAAQVTVLELGSSGFERGESALEPQRDIAGFGAGQVTSLAVSGNLVAVAVCARTSDRRGRVAFYAAGELDYLGAVSVGFGPDMLTFTPDGKTLLVANEGEQVRNADERIVSDPEGSVSIIDMSRGVSRAEVLEATFHSFDARVEEYRNAGVRAPRLEDRFFESGEGAVTLSRDLEPEYIAVSADGKTAWVSLQENDAVAVLDLQSRAFVDILPLGVKDFSVGLPTVEHLPLPAPPPGVTSHAGIRSVSRGLVRVVALAAEPAQATGLWFDALDSQPGRRVFYLVRDGLIERLVLEQGRLQPSGDVVVPEPSPAAGFRGLVRDPADHTFWLGGASDGFIYHLSPEGRLLHVFPLDRVRRDSPAASGRVPEPAGRAAGSVVVALAFDAQRRRLYVVHEPDRTAAGPATPRLARVLVLDADPRGATFGAALGEHLYLSDPPATSATGYGVAAAVFAGGDRLLVLEQAGAVRGGRVAPARRVFRADLTGSKNVLVSAAGSATPLATATADELYAGYGLSLMHKQRIHSLQSSEARQSASGLAVLDDASLVILEQAGPASERLAGQGKELEGAVLELVSFDDNNRFDASDRDGKADLRHWPVLGGYMPDGIEALRVAGRDYLVTANEGDTRQYDAQRLSEVELDARHFPEAASLQSSAMLGRLKIAAFDGDLDADGDVDEIHAFGARSVSVWDAAGNLVADTGSLFEEVTALGLSEAFNSNNDENGSFDTRSDDKGPEPEGLEVAEIDGRVYAFVGLERVGGIVVLDLTDPRGVAFVEYVNPRDFSGSAARGQARDLGPEGLRFVPAQESPTGRGLLLVGNEVSGTTSVYDVNL
jgi:hypothetical protein